MEQNNDKSYSTMYQLNLDNSRIFWFCLGLLIMLGVCFRLGMYFGHGNSRASTATAGTEQSVMRNDAYDTFLMSRMSMETQNNDFEFYRVLNKEKLTKEDLEHSIPYKEPPRLMKSDVKKTINREKEPIERLPADESGEVGDAQESQKPVEVGSVRKEPPLSRKVEIEKIGKEDAKPVRNQAAIQRQVPVPGKKYSIQVASYVRSVSAESEKQRLGVKGYKAFIVTGTVNNQTYYRLRVGPFTSNEKAALALRTLKDKLGYEGAYLCGN